jgi:hypothetical protein
MPEPTITVTAYGWRELEQKFGKSREYIYTGMDTAFRRIGNEILKPALVEWTPKGATKRLGTGTRGYVYGTKTDDMRLEMKQSTKALNDYAYGASVRVGQTPHFPPVAAGGGLDQWVQAKWGPGTRTLKGIDKRVWALANKISMYGTKPQPYHFDIIERELPNIRNVITTEIQKVCDRLAT